MGSGISGVADSSQELGSRQPTSVGSASFSKKNTPLQLDPSLIALRATDTRTNVSGSFNPPKPAKGSEESQSPTTLKNASSASFENVTQSQVLKVGDVSLPANAPPRSKDLWAKFTAVTVPKPTAKYGIAIVGPVGISLPSPERKNFSVASKIRVAYPQAFKMNPIGGQTGPIRIISSSANGDFFAAVVSGAKVARYCEGQQGRPVVEIKGHLDPVTAAALSRDGKFMVTASQDCSVCLWDINNSKKLREVPVTSQATVVAISDESDVIATSSTEEYVNLWDAKSCDPLYMFQMHSSTIYTISFSRKGSLVASGGANGEVFVWHSRTGEIRQRFTHHESAVLASSFSHDGTRLVTVDKETVRVWDTFTGELVFTRYANGKVVDGMVLHDSSSEGAPGRFTSCSFIAGNLIAVGMSSRQLYIVDPNNGNEVLMLETKAVVTCLSASWAGDILFIGDYLGNQYRLNLTFPARDVIAFGMKPPTKDKKEKISD